MSQKRSHEASQSRKKEFTDNNNEKSSQQNTPTLNQGEHHPHGAMMGAQDQFGPKMGENNRNYSFNLAPNNFSGFDQEPIQKN